MTVALTLHCLCFAAVKLTVVQVDSTMPCNTDRNYICKDAGEELSSYIQYVAEVCGCSAGSYLKVNIHDIGSRNAFIMLDLAVRMKTKTKSCDKNGNKRKVQTFC